MPPPPFSALKPGITHVNIVLKADQPTGKLTTGIVAEILTRGDHPRGVKVRLKDGRVGRVQAVLRGSVASSEVSGVWERESGGDGDGEREQESGSAVEGGGMARNGRDYRGGGSSVREDDAGTVTGSLMDFVRPGKQRRGRRGGRLGGGEEGGRRDGDESGRGRGNGGLDSDDGDGGAGGAVDDEMSAAQQVLEKEFPDMDTALVAAILLDYEGDVGAARDTLKVLM